jgi:DNA-binding winged helix-turn-helix (wHTH) protein
MKADEIFQFGEYQIDPLARTLRRREELVTLNRRAFDVLLYLVQNPGRAVTRDELLKNVWAETFVDENSLAQSISALRRALEEKPGDNSYIITLPGRGYQFVSPVQIVGPATVAPEIDVREKNGNTQPEAPITVAGDSSRGLLFQRQTIQTSVTTTEEDLRISAPISQNRFARTVPILIAAAALVAAGVGGAQYWRSHRERKLTEKDPIVLADFDNTTGDPVFDGTLRTALNVSLRQSPFLNVLPESEIEETLQQMNRPAGTKLTREVARELCLRVSSKAYIGGAIASLGTQYVVELKAVNCQNGDALAQEQRAAASKEKVLDTLGEMASKMRGQLGESLATVKKFDVPLERATTSSLEALKAYTGAVDVSSPALPHLLRAIELDPNFAMAYSKAGSEYIDSGQQVKANEYYSKAFQLREHATEREKLEIAANYYSLATGELDKAARAFQEFTARYPQEVGEGQLAVVYALQGRYEEAAEAEGTTARITVARGEFFNYANLANYALALQRFDEARRIIQDAQARGMDDRILHEPLYALAFLHTDSAALAAEQQYFSASSRPYWGLELASDTEAYAGHLQEERELSTQAVDWATRKDDKETGAIDMAIAAQREAAYGNPAEARRLAAAALKLAPTSWATESEAALAFALAGDVSHAAPLAQDLEKLFPLNTQMQSVWLPAIQAQLALDEKNPAVALKALPPPSPIELGQISFVSNISCLYSVYVRGEAYLTAGQGSIAASEFQKILDHSGIVWNCWTGALAHLGLARANALQAKTSHGADAEAARTRALAAYKDFLTLWKDADPDIPIYKQAKAEYAKLDAHNL